MCGPLIWIKSFEPNYKSQVRHKIEHTSLYVIFLTALMKTGLQPTAQQATGLRSYSKLEAILSYFIILKIS
jgi:hypothetical protein